MTGPAQVAGADRAATRRFLLTVGLAPSALILGAAVPFVIWVLSFQVDLVDLPSASPSLWAVFAVAAFYAAAAIASCGGSLMGSTLASSHRLQKANWTKVYRRLTFIAVFGVALTYITATKGNIDVVIDLVAKQEFNRLRQEVPFEAGLASLRYATIPAGGLAVYRVVHDRRAAMIDLLNLIALVLGSAFASRLTLVAAIVIGAYLYVRTSSRGLRGRHHTSARRIVVLGFAALLAMTAMNYVRNANYYRENAGIENPVTMLWLEVVRYASTPARVAMAVEGSDRLSAFSGEGSADVLGGVRLYGLPTYATSADPSSGAVGGGDSGARAYRQVVDVPSSLTTNSVQAEMAGVLGRSTIAVLILLLVPASALCAHFSRYRSPALLVAPIIGYAFLELWRVWLFNTGILHFAALITLGLCLASSGRSRHDLFPDLRAWQHSRRAAVASGAPAIETTDPPVGLGGEERSESGHSSGEVRSGREEPN